MCVCGMYHHGGMLVFSINVPDRRRLRNGLVFGGTLIPCCVCAGDSGEVAGRTEAGICLAVHFQPPTPTPGFSESLGVFFRLWERPQTAELDKPRHFAVTSLGLTSGLGWSVRSG